MDKLFIPVKDNRQVSKHLPELVSLVKSFDRIAVTSTIQFSYQIPEVIDSLKSHEVIKCPPVLGCRALIPKIDCTVIISTGVFHAINVALITNKPVFIISPSGVFQLDEKIVKDFKKKQAIRVSKVLNAEVIGVLVSTKSGQSNIKLAWQIINQLRTRDKKPFFFVANELSPSQLNDFPVDAWINTACPRLIEDDFNKPIVNWSELENLFK